MLAKKLVKFFTINSQPFVRQAVKSMTLERDLESMRK